MVSACLCIVTSAGQVRAPNHQPEEGGGGTSPGPPAAWRVNSLIVDNWQENRDTNSAGTSTYFNQKNFFSKCKNKIFKAPQVVELFLKVWRGVMPIIYLVTYEYNFLNFLKVMRQPNLQSPMHCNKDKVLQEYVVIIQSVASHSRAEDISSPGNLSLTCSHWEMV